MTTEYPTSHKTLYDSLASKNPHLTNMNSDDKDELIGKLYNEVSRLQRVLDAVMIERDQLMTALDSRPSQAGDSNYQGNVENHVQLHDGIPLELKLELELEEILVSDKTIRRSRSRSGSGSESDTSVSSDSDSSSISYPRRCGTSSPEFVDDVDIGDNDQYDDCTESFDDFVEEELDTRDEIDFSKEEFDTSLLVSNRTHFLNNIDFEMPTPRTGWEKYARRTFIPCLSVIPETGDFLLTVSISCSNLETDEPVEMYIEEIPRCTSSLGFTSNSTSEKKSWFDMTMEDEEDEFW